MYPFSNQKLVVPTRLRSLRTKTCVQFIVIAYVAAKAPGTEQVLNKYSLTE